MSLRPLPTALRVPLVLAGCAAVLAGQVAVGSPAGAAGTAELAALPAAVLGELSTVERQAADDLLDAGGSSTVGLVVVEGGRSSVAVVESTPADAPALADLLEAQPSVRVASVAAPVRGTATDQYRYLQWPLDRLKAEQVWTAPGLPAGTAMPVVADIDSGVQGDHPDLAGRTTAGWDFVTGVATAAGAAVDGNGHGTHVAGILGAGVQDGVGVSGLVPRARIMPVRVLDDAASGNTARTAQGVRWAVDHGASVLNLSLGGHTTDPVLADAVSYAEAQGVVVVAAAGNDGNDGSGGTTVDPALPVGDNATSYPCAYPLVLCVASTDSADAHSAFSTHNAAVDLAAPGTKVASTYKGSTWVYLDGTSMATPYAAAAAVLTRAAHPAFTPAQVRALMTSTALDLGAPGRDDLFGAGLVQPLATVAVAPASPQPPSAPSGVTATAGAAGVTIAWQPVPGATGYRVHRAVGGGAAVLLASPAGSPYVDAAAQPGTTYRYEVRAVNEAGESVAGTATVTTAPASPGSVAVSRTGTDNVVTWTASTGATGYRVQRSVDGGEPVVVPVSGTAYTDVTAAAGHRYAYAVQATGAGGSSAAVSAALAVAPPAPVLRGSRSGSAAVLEWDAVEGADAYAVSADGAVVSTGPTTRAEVALPEGEHRFSVVASGPSGTSAASPELVLVGGATAPAAPAAPASASAALAGTQVRVTWTAVDGATGYSVERSTDGGSWLPLTAAGTAATEQLDPAPPAHAHAYRVRATGPGGASAAVPAGEVAVPLPEPALTGSVSALRADLSWAPVAGATAYRLERDGVVVATLTTTGVQDPDLAAGRTYGYTVAATAPGGWTTRSQVLRLTVAPAPGAPVSLGATAGAPGALTVSWGAAPATAGAAVTGYRVSVGAVSRDVAAGTRSAAWTGLVPGSTYEVSVAALSAVGPGTARRTAYTVPQALKTTVKVKRPTAVTYPTTAALSVTLTGAVGAQDPVPLAGAVVELWAARHGKPLARQATARTDRNGTAVLQLAVKAATDVQVRYAGRTWDAGTGALPAYADRSSTGTVASTPTWRTSVKQLTRTSVRLSGTLAPVHSGTAVLERWDGTRWRALRDVALAQGTATRDLTLHRQTTYRHRWHFAGDADHRGAVSATMTTRLP